MAAEAFRGAGVLACAVLLVATASLAPVRADLLRQGTTERVSEAWDDGEPTGGSRAPAISGDGRFIAFQSSASNLVPGDTNGMTDIFVRDRATGWMERVSVDSSGGEANEDSDWPAISDNGRFVAFLSDASNLVPSDDNGRTDLFLRDRVAGTTERLNSPHEEARGGASISADGRWVTYLVYSAQGVRLLDRSTGTTSTPGTYANSPTIARDGSVVAFWRSLSLDPVDQRVFVWDPSRGTLEWVSEGLSSAFGPALSADGRFVAWMSIEYEANLHVADLWVLDRFTGSKAFLENAAQGYARLSLSADGSLLAFTAPLPVSTTSAPPLPPGPPLPGVYLWDTVRNTLTPGAVDGNGFHVPSAREPAMSPDGRFLAFVSDGPLTKGALDWTTSDVFLRDRAGACTLACAPLT